jgi:hypothetical protein
MSEFELKSAAIASRQKVKYILGEKNNFLSIKLYTKNHCPGKGDRY